MLEETREKRYALCAPGTEQMGRKPHTFMEARGSLSAKQEAGVCGWVEPGHPRRHL